MANSRQRSLPTLHVLHRHWEILHCRSSEAIGGVTLSRRLRAYKHVLHQTPQEAASNNYPQVPGTPGASVYFRTLEKGLWPGMSGLDLPRFTGVRRGGHMLQFSGSMKAGVAAGVERRDEGSRSGRLTARSQPRRCSTGGKRKDLCRQRGVP